MKVGEIWEYCGPKELENYQLAHLDDVTRDKFGDDSKVCILAIIKADSIEVIMPEDGEIELESIRDLEDFIEFEHVESKAIGVLDRNDFVTMYKRVYE